MLGFPNRSRAKLAPLPSTLNICPKTYSLCQRSGESLAGRRVAWGHGGVRAPGGRFACLGGCSRTWWGNTCRWGYGARTKQAETLRLSPPRSPAPKPDRPTDRPKRWAKSHITETRSHKERTSRNTYTFLHGQDLFRSTATTRRVKNRHPNRYKF